MALAALTLARLAVAAWAPLAPDEAYYWVWSRALAPGYLDAPPMVALWVRAGTGIAGDTALGIRLLGPVSAALGSVLLWHAGEVLLPGRRAGLIAVALLNATLLFGVGAVIMTPDTPLLFFWVCCIWALACFARSQRGAWLTLALLFAGLALASKYTAALLAPAIGLWLLSDLRLRRWLLRPAFWLGVLAAALVFLPVGLWNAAHAWASFAKQGGRVGDFRPSDAARFLGELVAGQFGLATPLVFILCVAGAALAVRLAWRQRDPAWVLLALLTLIPAAVFVEHAFGDRVQANWPAIIYPSAVIAAAGLERRTWIRLRSPAVALGLAITAVVYVQATAAPIALPMRLDPTALRLADWRGLAVQVEAARMQAGASFIACDEYGTAAELALARVVPRPIPVIGVEPRWARFRLPAPQNGGEVGILVRSERRGADIDLAPWASVRPIGVAQRARDGVKIERYRLFRVVARPGLTPEAVLPRP